MQTRKNDELTISGKNYKCCQLKMVEIKGPQWKGWHNLILDLGGPEFDKAIAGPIDPETSIELKVSINASAGLKGDRMQTAEQKAKEWLSTYMANEPPQNVIDGLIAILKDQDLDTRRACVDAVLKCEIDAYGRIGYGKAIEGIMNTKACG